MVEMHLQSEQQGAITPVHSTRMKQEVYTTVPTCCCAGENSIIIVGGANQASWQLSESAKQLVQRAGAVLLQREIPEAVNTEVAQLARSAGVPVILDAGGVEAPVSEELLSNVTMLSPNETELARLTGCPTEDLQQVGAAGAADLRTSQRVLQCAAAQGV
jgi:sugar/nucleoside kinase (ribokinase family)